MATYTREQIPECFGIGIGGFKVKEEWSGKIGVDVEKQEKCANCPLFDRCFKVCLIELQREK